MLRIQKLKKGKNVRFGSGGLRAKINDSKARKAFAAKDINAHRKKIEQKLHIGAVDYHVMQNYSDLNQASQDSGKPYIDLEITDDYILREFSETIDPIELLWHRDDEARTVEIIGETDWMLH